MTGKISVVIPVYNAGPQFGDCLRALGSQSLPRESFKIIVVDDGSSDDSAAVAEACRADFRAGFSYSARA